MNLLTLFRRQLPFGEDVRSFEFPSLSNLFNRKGLRIETHPLLPTKEQDAAMDEFVDAMDLTKAAKDDGDGLASETAISHSCSLLKLLSHLPVTLHLGSISINRSLPPFTTFKTLSLSASRIQTAIYLQFRESSHNTWILLDGSSNLLKKRKLPLSKLSRSLPVHSLLPFRTRTRADRSFAYSSSSETQEDHESERELCSTRRRPGRRRYCSIVWHEQSSDRSLESPSSFSSHCQSHRSRSQRLFAISKYSISKHSTSSPSTDRGRRRRYGRRT